MTDNELADLLEEVNKETGVRHIRVFDHAKILLRKLEERQQWQYLTDDEIKEIVGSYGEPRNGLGIYTRGLFDKIEAKIREKNGPTKTPPTANDDEADVASGIRPSDSSS